MADPVSVNLGGLVIDGATADADGVLWRATSLDGWFDTPASTMSFGELAQGGQTVTVARLEARAVAAEFLARAAFDNVALGNKCFLAMDRIKRAVEATFQSVLMQVTDPAHALQSRVRLAQPLRSRIQGDLGAVLFSVPLLCPDPRRYSQALHTVALSAGSNVVTNAGDVPTPVVLTLHGAATNPQFQNTTAAGNPILAYTGVFGAVDLVIDTNSESVTVNGINQRSGLTTPQWWNLLPGANTIVVDYACTIAFRDAYQ